LSAREFPWRALKGKQGRVEVGGDIARVRSGPIALPEPRFDKCTPERCDGLPAPRVRLSRQALQERRRRDSETAVEGRCGVLQQSVLVLGDVAGPLVGVARGEVPQRVGK
jgi:hypothetical protein